MTIRAVRTFAKSWMPFLVPLWRRLRTLHLLGKRPDRIFTEIYRENAWGDSSSVSGAGSNLAQTEAIRRALPLLVDELTCHSLLDLPCGDFFWMQRVPLDIPYIGGDLVAELIAVNQRQFGSERRRFICVDLIRDTVPRADLILCRDCLVHLSDADVFRALKNLKASGSSYLLTTTFTGRKKNSNIATGGWRPLNLQRPPFSFPPPTKLIDEQCPMHEYRDKGLGLWKMADLPDFPERTL